ncbi:MAG: tryptophan synthase subunit alpha [Candidatus Nanopelagicales bacterium]|nr:tryptophan synthase subunit alpha [Candidatus Nanopelagicales bacterium]
MTRHVSEAFATAKAENRAALIGYLPAGFPNPVQSVKLINAMVASGVDIIEVGLPYSDPLMDGPVIQQAVDQALEAGTTTDVVLNIVKQVVDAGAIAVVMSYWNPIERYGIEKFATGLEAAGGSGVIAPDLTPEEAGDWSVASDAHAIDRILMVAPSSTDARIASIVGVTSGFVYAASTMGVTGARTTVSSGAHELVARTRAATSLPIAVGLGVSTGDQAAEIAAYADGVIVGSAFVRRVLDAPSDEAAIEAVSDLAKELAAGVRR